MRKLFTFAMAILLAVCIFSVFPSSYARIEPDKPDRYTLHTVKPGDTFWEIACRYLPGVDPRVAVQWIKEANGLEDEPEYVMQPGDRLNVPCRDGEMAEPWGQE